MQNRGILDGEMQESQEIEMTLPLRVPVSKRKMFSLTLNEYRNAHYQVLSKAKKAYAALVSVELFRNKRHFDCVEIDMTFHPRTKRKWDLDNVACVTAKFLLDALVTNKVIDGDDSRYVKRITARVGEKRENKEVVIKVREI